MQISHLSHQPELIHQSAAQLLTDCLGNSNSWPSLESASEELRQILIDGFALAAIQEDQVIGWIGGLPEYSGRVWELHPLVVHPDYRLRGLGRELVESFEKEVFHRGGLTITLGTDDDSGSTSLSHCDLYSDLPGKIATITDLGKSHPFLFYKKLGFTVTGVLPDANGIGFPDIFMSRRVRSEWEK